MAPMPQMAPMAPQMMQMSQMAPHPQMAAALGMGGMGMGMNLSMRDMSGRPAGGAALINPVMNMGNNGVAYQPMGNFAALPVGTVMQPGLVPNVAVSTQGQSFQNLMENQMIRSLRGNVNPQESVQPPGGSDGGSNQDN